MKKIVIYTLYASLLMWGLVSCNETMLDDNHHTENSEGAVVLQLSTGLTAQSRAHDDMADEEWEYALKHLDIMIFTDDTEDEQKTLFHHERVAVNGPSGTVTLEKSRDDFSVGMNYWFYVVANSTAPETTFSGIGTVQTLKELVQEDPALHLTGLKLENVPSHFLMDGIAFLSSSAEPQEPGAVVINDGSQNETILKVILRRAAAKVVVKLTHGEKVTFAKDIAESSHTYYLRNMPYKTRVLDPKEDVKRADKDDLRLTSETISDYYKWIDDNEVVTKIELTGYVYAHTWNTNESFEYATNLILNIPIKFETGSGENSIVSYDKNYYQIPLTKDFKFERNKYYEVQAVINAPGAEDVSIPVLVDDLNYSVHDWTEKTISVGDVAGPEYLKVNLDELQMYNIAEDATTLLFSSSSPVTITVENAYYIDKFGVQQDISPSAYHIAGTTGTGAISGNITVQSDIPTNNTIRYFTLKIVNQTGQEETVDVEQYPLVYITNQQGWYSYRSDFGSHYQLKGTRNVSVSLDMDEAGPYWDRYEYWSGSYNYGTSKGSSSYFWHSKVAVPNSNGDGKSSTYFYGWNQNSTNSTASYDTDDDECEDNTNARMYHVRITASSPNYAVGRPRLDSNGYTDGSTDNAKLVSPSFMIASRLGAIYTTYGNLNDISDNEDYNNNGIPDRRDIFHEHCYNYVEVYKDENGSAVVLDNWRLPTEAELKIIEGLQGSADESADAIDYLLNGRYYMSASGPVFNYKANQEGDLSAIRCVRDAY